MSPKTAKVLSIFLSVLLGSWLASFVVGIISSIFFRDSGNFLLPIFYIALWGYSSFFIYKRWAKHWFSYKPNVVAAVPAVETKKQYPPMPQLPGGTGNTHGTANWQYYQDIYNQYNGKKENSLEFKSLDKLYIGGGYEISEQVHAVTIAGSGQGKGVSLIIPNLLMDIPSSWFILDPKGELALTTAKYQKEVRTVDRMMRGDNDVKEYLRQSFRDAGANIDNRVIILDPWNEQERLGATHGIAASGFNPLYFVKSNPDEMPEMCGVIAEMIIPENPDLKDPYWSNRARALIKTYLLHLITGRPEEEQHLGTLYRWLRLAFYEREVLWAEMRENMECDGLVRSGISEFIGMEPDKGPLPSIISNAQDNTTFLESKQLRASLQKNDFDPYELTEGRRTVYVCLPERFLDTHFRWLRIVTGVCLKACNYKPNDRVNFLLDEFAILGKMPDVERAFAFGRGQNISVWIFVQSLTQLIQIYGEHGANTFLANARLRQFFGIYDLSTQKYLSEYLGDTTIKTITKSQSYTTGSSYGSSNGSSYQEAGRRLLTGEEIGKNLGIITLLDGHKLLIPKLSYWENMYDAHLAGRATYYPLNRRDWENFIDELEGLKKRRWYFCYDEKFIPLADGKKAEPHKERLQKRLVSEGKMLEE